MNKPVSRLAPKRHKIGEVVFLAEKMQMARQLSSCCVGTEALLESGFERQYSSAAERVAAESEKHR